jgi:acyl-CoA hydrolase
MAAENTTVIPEAAGTLSEAARPGPEAHLDEWVAPDIADERGFLRAGKILEWMDVVGVLAASRHCRRPVATASVDGMELSHPIRVGERVTMTASVGYTSERSLGVSVSMRHGTPAAEQRSLTGYMTFVALDPRGKAAPVPQLRPQTPAEVARFREGNLRREFRSKLRSGQLPAPSPQTGGDQALFVRELMKLLPRSLLPIGRGDALEPRRRHVSYVHKIEPVRGSKLNFQGTLYGGTLMRWIETTANLSARAYLDGVPVRLSGLHGLTFIRPVRRHVFVHVRSAVAHTSAESLTVLVNVDSEQPLAGEQEETLRAFLTYVPVDARVRIPPIECLGDEERKAFDEVEHRLALQRSLLVT